MCIRDSEFAAGLERLPRPDLVHSHHWMSGMAALDAAAAWGVPHVQSYHSVAALPGSPLSDGEPPESVSYTHLDVYKRQASSGTGTGFANRTP